MRIFFAIAVDKATTKKLRRELEKLKLNFQGAIHWVDESTWHITVKFFAEVDLQALETLTNSMAAVVKSIHYFSVVLERIGLFPDAHGKHLAAHISLNEPLTSLHCELGSVARSLGIAPEYQSFLPHITLAKTQVPLIVPQFPLTLTMPVREVVLYESKAGNYVMLRHFKLLK